MKVVLFIAIALVAASWQSVIAGETVSKNENFLYLAKKKNKTFEWIYFPKIDMNFMHFVEDFYCCSAKSWLFRNRSTKVPWSERKSRRRLDEFLRWHWRFQLRTWLWIPIESTSWRYRQPACRRAVS